MQPLKKKQTQKQDPNSQYNPNATNANTTATNVTNVNSNIKLEHGVSTGAATGGHSGSFGSSANNIETELSILLPYLKRMSLAMAGGIVTGINRDNSDKDKDKDKGASLDKGDKGKEVKDNKESKDIDKGGNGFQYYKEFAERIIGYWNIDGLGCNQAQVGKINPLIQLLCRFLKLQKIRQSLTPQSRKPKPLQLQKQAFHPFQPISIRIPSSLSPLTSSSQLSASIPSRTLDPLQCLSPSLQTFSKMFKTLTELHISTSDLSKQKQLNETYTFYSPPRFLTRLEQFKDFETNFAQRGNIIMINFQGIKITGKRGFVIVGDCGNIMYFWVRDYKDYRDFLGEFGNGEDGKKKDERDREREDGKAENQHRYHQGYKLSYKMVGHHGKITSISLSDDQYYLLSTGTDCTIKLWCLRQKCLLAQYRGHVKTVWSVNWSKSGYFFASGSADRTIKLWSTDEYIPQRIFLGHNDDITKVQFLPNPDLLASASQDRTIRIWNTFTAQCLNIIKLNKSIINFKSSLSGRYFIACDFGGSVYLYDFVKGELVSQFRVPEKEGDRRNKGDKRDEIRYLRIHDLSFSIDEKQLALISSKYILLYSLDKIFQKQSKSIYSHLPSFPQPQNPSISNPSSVQLSLSASPSPSSAARFVATKQVINTGRDSNLIFCEYLDKGVLVIGSCLARRY